MQKLNLPGKPEFMESLSRYRRRLAGLQKKIASNSSYGLTFFSDEIVHKKSERTTFSLSKKAFEAVAWLAKNSGIKVKEVFEPIVNRGFYNLIGARKDLGDEEAIFQKLTKFQEPPRIRKTYVISMGTLLKLNNVSKHFNIPRDVILDNLILDYADSIKQDIENRNKRYQITLDNLIKLSELANDLQEDFEMKFNYDKGLLEELYNVTHAIENSILHISDAIKTGKPLITFHERYPDIDFSLIFQ